MGTLRVHRPGMLTTIQDLGRPGWSAIGVPIGGAADPLSLRIGNRLLGNPDNAAALEMTMLGGTFVFESDATVTIVGGNCQCSIGAHPAPMNAPFHIPAGATLAIGPITLGVRTYLCTAGGIIVPPVLGSRSTHIAAGFGGFAGRALLSGDQLQFGESSPAARSDRSWPARPLSRTLRILSSLAALNDLFWRAEHTISPRSNRTGVRLQSPPISLASTGRMISEGMPPGAIQLPPGGEPIILGPDHPTTGGYPILACVASVDLHLIGQLRPGDTLRFAPITQREALEALRERERTLDSTLPPAPGT